MNELVIPPSANWYETSIIACAKDNTLVYGARSDIVVIKQTEENVPSEVRIIAKAHSQKVISVSVNKNWGAPNKYAVTVSEDKIVKLWDIEALTKKLSHKEHFVHDRVVGANFGGEDRVISVSENGKIVVWNILLNEFQKLDIFGNKDVITCISTCPHAGWLTAFGMKNGLVAVCDLRKNGKILYKLRGHDKSVLSLAWCPAPVNIFPASPRNTVGEKKPQSSSAIEAEETQKDCAQPNISVIDQLCEEVSKILEITGQEEDDELVQKKEHKVIKKKKDNPWINLKHADDEEVPPDYADRGRGKPIVYEGVEDDFLKECMMVKKQILGEEVEEIEEETPKKQDTDMEEMKPDELKQVSEEIRVLGEEVEEIKKETSKKQDTNMEEKKAEELIQISEEIEEALQDLKLEGSENEDTEAKDVEIKEESKDTEDTFKETTDENKETTQVDQNDPKEASKNEDIKSKNIEIKEESKDTGGTFKETTDENNETTQVDQKDSKKASENECIKSEDIKIKEESKDTEDTFKGTTEENKETTRVDQKDPKKASENEDIKPKNIEIKEESKDTEDTFKKTTEENKEITQVDQKDPKKASGNEDIKSEDIKIKEESKDTEDTFKETTEENKETTHVEQKDPKKASGNEDIKSDDIEIKEESKDTEDTFKETTEENKETTQVDQKDPKESSGNVDIKSKDIEIKEESKNTEDTSKETTEENEETSHQTKSKHEKNVKQTNEEVGRVIHIEEIEEEPRKEFLLASSARESNIYIWRAGTDGRMQTFVTVPNKQNYRRSGKPSNDKIWISLCWPTANTLLSSSKSGELLEWSLPKERGKDKHYKLVHRDHNTLLFSIASPCVLLDKTNWKSRLVSNVWTVGLDRNILNTSLTSEHTNLSCLPTFGGPINCISVSPVDPNRVAFGSGEGIIKVWDMSRPHTKQITMAHFYQKIQGKVTSLAWHPDKELLLAYATHEGRIGIFDSSNSSKTPTLFKHYFKGQIHKIEFGPLSSGKKDSLGIYAVAEGKLVIFDVRKPDRDPVEVETPDDTFVYMFAWKPDLSKLIVSTKAKTLLEYDSDLKLVTTHYVRMKFDQILWHPDAVNNNEDASKYSNCFVGTTNSNEFVVYNTDKSDGDKNNEAQIFKGFEENINAVSWSPFNGNHIVSVGEDGVAQVWDIETNTKLATHIHEGFEPILSVIWSPINEDCIIIGGKNYVTSVWKISNNPPREENDLLQQRKTVLAALQTESNDLLPKTAKLFDETEKVKPKKSSKNSLLPAFYSAKDAESHIDDLKKLLAWKEETSEKCTASDKSNELDAEVGSVQNDILKIYGNNEDMADILNTNLMLNKHKGKFNNGNIVALMKGDMKGAVLSAIEEKRVTPWIISVSPMISTEVWLKSCATYVSQLKESPEADPLEITTYLLVQHKIAEAVEVLCEHAMFREALALAKCRLIGDDKIVESITLKWAQNAVTTGQFETAAQCYIFLKQYDKAAMILYRRSDQKTLEFAAVLARKSGNAEMHDEILKRLNLFNPVAESSNLNPDAQVFVCTRENSDDSAQDDDIVVVTENDLNDD